MSSRRDTRMADSIWPAVARAIFSDTVPEMDIVGPPVLPGTRVDFESRDAARVIRARELDLALAGVVIADDN